MSCRFIAGASCHDLSLPFVSSFVFLNLFPLLLLYASTKGTLNPPQDEVNIKINRYINLALVLYGFSLYFLFLISLWNPTSLSGRGTQAPSMRVTGAACLFLAWENIGTITCSARPLGPCTGKPQQNLQSPAPSSALPSRIPYPVNAERYPSKLNLLHQGSRGQQSKRKSVHFQSPSH